MLGFTFSVWGGSVGCLVSGDILCNMRREKMLQCYILRGYRRRVHVKKRAKKEHGG